MEEVKPIRPSDIPAAKQVVIPPEVIQVFNELIAKNFKNGRSQVYLYEASNKIFNLLGKCNEEWLEIEYIYQKAGWNVIFYSYSYSEPYFTFTEKE